METQTDGKGQPYIKWMQCEGRYKRAWIIVKSGDHDYAKAGRYLQIGPCDADGKPKGNSIDLPIFSKLSDEQTLFAFVHAVNAITGMNLHGGFDE